MKTRNKILKGWGLVWFVNLMVVMFTAVTYTAIHGDKHEPEWLTKWLIVTILLLLAIIILSIANNIKSIYKELIKFIQE